MNARRYVSITIVAAGFAMDLSGLAQAQQDDNICWDGGEPQGNDDRNNPWRLYCYEENGYADAYLILNSDLDRESMGSSGLPNCPNRGECVGQLGQQFFDIPDIGVDISEHGYKDWRRTT